MLMIEVYQKLKDFCNAALNDEQVKVISSNQFATRPKKPFIAIHISSCDNVSTFSDSVSTDGTKSYSILKTITATFNCYTDNHLAAQDYLIKIYNMLSTELTFQIFGESLAYLSTIRNVVDVSLTVSDKIENRALMELAFNVTQATSFNTGIIEQVQLNDELIT